MSDSDEQRLYLRLVKIQAAAAQAVSHHLEMFEDSMSYEDIWESNPDLTEAEMEEAQRLSRLMATSVAGAVQASAAAVGQW